MHDDEGAATADLSELRNDEPRLHLSPVVPGAPITVGHGFHAQQFLHGHFAGNAMSPFVLVDHFHMSAPTFEVHPHAGISAVTLVFEDTRGLMKSVDSVGHQTMFGAGDLHWTLAGRGILHTQLPADTASYIHALQIFVNLPARLKSLPPTSFKVNAADMPELKARGWRLRVVAGELAGRRSPARTPEPVLMIDGYLDPSHAPLALPIAADWNAWLHVVEGAVTVDDGASLLAGQALCASARSVGGTLELRSDVSSHFVLLAGPRIDEPVIQNGPFVFTSDADGAQALADLRAGRFGQVPAHISGSAVDLIPFEV